MTTFAAAIGSPIDILSKVEIQRNSVVVDFYVSKKKFKSYKTERGRKNYVWKKLNAVLAKVPKLQQGLKILEFDPISNYFWGEDFICTPNDLGYNINNQVHKAKGDKLCVRDFSVEMIAVKLEETAPNLPKFQGEDYYIISSSYKLLK